MHVGNLSQNTKPVVTYYDESGHPPARLDRRMGVVLVIWGAFLTVGGLSQAQESVPTAVGFLTVGLTMLGMALRVWLLPNSTMGMNDLRVTREGISFKAGSVRHHFPSSEIRGIREGQGKYRHYYSRVELRSGEHTIVPRSADAFEDAVEELIADRSRLGVTEHSWRLESGILYEELYRDGWRDALVPAARVLTALSGIAIAVSMVVMVSLVPGPVGMELPVAAGAGLIASGSIIGTLILARLGSAASYEYLSVGRHSVRAVDNLGGYIREVEIGQIESVSSGCVFGILPVVNIKVHESGYLPIRTRRPEALIDALLSATEPDDHYVRFQRELHHVDFGDAVMSDSA